MNNYTDEYRKQLYKLAESMKEVGFEDADIELFKSKSEYKLMMLELGVQIL